MRLPNSPMTSIFCAGNCHCIWYHCNMLTRILGFLWTVWCALCMVLTFIILLPFFAILVNSGRPSWKVQAHYLVTTGARIITFLWGIRIIQHDAELVDKKKQFVYVSNHRSDLDSIVTMAIMDGYFKYLGKEELLKWPAIGYLVGKLYVTVKRSDQTSRENCVVQMEEQIRKGASIMIFPEGWSNFSNEYLIEFKQGAFRLAVKSKIPIVVYTIIGSYELWPKPKMRVRPGNVHIYWERIIPTDHLNVQKEIDVEGLEEEVRNILLKRLKNNYPNGFQYPTNWPSFEDWKQGQLGRE